MAQSVGAVALDIVMGKNTVTGTVQQAMAECQSTINSSSATIGSSVSAVGRACTNVGAAMMPVTAAVVGLGTASFTAASSFEDAMAKVSTIADTTEVPLDDLESSILDLSNQTGISANVIADNVYNAISAGQSTGDAVNFVSNSTKLATAGFADAGASLDVLTTILNSYGMEASEVTKVSDMLVQTQNLGKTTVAELSSSMGKVIPTANAYGVGLDNVCSSYAILTANGIATAESTTYMNSMLNELGKSGTGVSNILKEQTGQSFAELMAGGASLGDVLGILQQYCADTETQFGDLWGSAEAGKAALVLTKDGADGFNSTLTEMQNSTGATDSAFEKMQTTSWSMKQAINELKNTMIDLGGSLMTALGPIIQDVCAKVKEFSAWFGNLDDETKRTILTVAAVVAAIGPVLIVIGKVVSGVGTLISAGTAIATFISGTLVPAVMGAGTALMGFITGTIVPALTAFFTFLAANPIVLIIGAIIAIGVVLATHWEQTKAIASAVWEGICNIFTTVWEAIKSAVSSAIEFIHNIIVTVFEAIKTNIQNSMLIWQTIITTVWNAIKTAVTTVVNAIKTVVTSVFNAIKTVITTVVNFIKAIITTGFNNMKLVITTVVNAIKTVVTTVWNAIKTVITTVFSAISSVVSSVWNGIKNTISTVVNGIKNTVTNVFNSIKSGISNIIGGIKDTISNGFNAAFDFIKAIPSQALEWGKDIIQGFIDGIKNMIGSVKDAVSSVGDAVKSFLHFSVPDEGPLTDYETWMPDMMQGLANGITGSKYKVVDALKELTGDMSVNPALQVQAPIIKGTSTSNNPSTATDKLDRLIEILLRLIDGKDRDDKEMIVPIYIGNELIDEYILGKNSRTVIRSGGRA